MNTATPTKPAASNKTKDIVDAKTVESFETQLARFREKMAPKLAEVAEYKNLIVTDLEDKEMTKSVEDAHKDVRKLRIAIENKRKELKAPVLAHSKLIDSTAKELSEEVGEVEDHLKLERDKIDAEKARKKAEKEKAAQAELQARVDALAAVNGDVSDLLRIKVMTEDSFAAELEQATADNTYKERLQAVTFSLNQLDAYGGSLTLDEAMAMPADELTELIAKTKVGFEERQAELQRQQEAEQKRIDAERMELEQLRAEKARRDEEDAARQLAEAEAAAEAQAEIEEARKLKEAPPAAPVSEPKTEAKPQSLPTFDHLEPQKDALLHFAQQLRTLERIPLLDDHSDFLDAVIEDSADSIVLYANSLGQPA